MQGAMLQEFDEVGRTKERTGEVVEVHGGIIPEEYGIGGGLPREFRRASDERAIGIQAGGLAQVYRKGCKVAASSDSTRRQQSLPSALRRCA